MRKIVNLIALSLPLLLSSAKSLAQNVVPGPVPDSREKVCAFVRSDDRCAGINEDDACPLFSVVKFPQALYVANCLSESGKSLDDKLLVRKRRLMQDTWSPMLGTFKSRHRFSYAELLRLSLVESDNNACDLLFGTFGSPAEVEQYISGIGFPGILIRSTERQQMEDRSTAALNATSPKEMAGLLEWFYQHHDDNEYLAYIWHLMSECNTGLSRLPAAVAEGDSVIHKTGTGFATATGVAAINDAGIIIHPDGTHSVAVVFVLNHHGRPDSAEALLAERARTLMAETAKDSGNVVCIYDDTSASVTAAYAAAQKESSVTVICPDVTIGGMTTGGLGATDIGNKRAVIGLALMPRRASGNTYVGVQWNHFLSEKNHFDARSMYNSYWGPSFELMYDWDFPVSSVNGLSLYLGPGVHGGYITDYNGFGDNCVCFGLTAAAGLEYVFSELPIALSDIPFFATEYARSA